MRKVDIVANKIAPLGNYPAARYVNDIFRDCKGVELADLDFGGGTSARVTVRWQF